MSKSNTELAHTYEPEAAYAQDLKLGDLVVLDAFYGAEEIVSTPSSLKLSNGVKCVHFGACRRGTKTEVRFVVRGDHEPVTRWKVG